MENNNLIFALNEQERIVVQLPHSIEHLTYDCKDLIIFEGTKSLVISDDYTKEAIKHFIKMLTKAMSGKLKLHFSITENIGYLWNEANQDSAEINNPKIFYTNDGLWIGVKENHLWAAQTSIQLDTWLYNNSEDNIIFEITPYYPWHDKKIKENKEFMPYELWIKTYKPLLTRTIPKSVALKWLSQAQYILQKINESDSKI